MSSSTGARKNLKQNLGAITSGFLHPYIYRYTARVPRDRFLASEGEGMTWMRQPSRQGIALFSVRTEFWRGTGPTRHGDARFSEGLDFSPRLFPVSCQVIRVVRTFFGQDDRPLHEDVAPASRARNGKSEAVAASKLDPIWTPTLRRESGTLVHRVVK
jgi:hypothetical protein